MWPPSLPLLRRAALVISLFSLTYPEAVRADMNPGDIEWSLSAPPAEADPKSFPAVAIHLRNQTTSAQTLRLHFDLGPLRSLGGPDLEVALEASEEKTVLYTLHVPPETPGGSDIPLRARANDGTERGTSIRIKAVPDCKATAESVDTRFVRPGEKAAYKVKIVNTGNIPLHCALHPTTSPQATSNGCNNGEPGRPSRRQCRSRGRSRNRWRDDGFYSVCYFRGNKHGGVERRRRPTVSLLSYRGVSAARAAGPHASF